MSAPPTAPAATSGMHDTVAAVSALEAATRRRDAASTAVVRRRPAVSAANDGVLLAPALEDGLGARGAPQAGGPHEHWWGDRDLNPGPRDHENEVD